MKNVPNIIDTWETGFFVGNRRAQTRVTVEKDWYLNKTGVSYGTSKRGPFRWYQRADNSQVETELPNVKSVSIDRSIDTDMATCKIDVYNQWMIVNGAVQELAGELGKPGYFSWARGHSQEALARWNQEGNDWQDVLVPDALVRTYQGYGGFNEDGTPMDIADAVEGGYLTLTGVWLADTVQLDAAGILHMDLRDVGKFLAVQQVYPPLVPNNLYPVDFHRWNITNYDATFNARKPTTTGSVQEINPGYLTSSADAWYGHNANIHGHRGSDSVDGNNQTYAMSVGNSGPDKPFATDYWEYSVGGQVNEIYLYPWGGNYTMYISVFENGQWVGNGQGDIPYDPSILFATQSPAVNTGAAIPFVSQQGTTWESGQWYQLGRVFNAEKIRITFRHETASAYGPWFYRCGIRELKVRVNTLVTSPPADPWVYSMDTWNDPNAINETGYICVADDGQVFAFGDAKTSAQNDGKGYDDKAWRIRSNPAGTGYWVLQTNGRVHSYGDAVHHGDPITGGDVYNGWVDIVPTYTGAGYWVFAKNGTVRHYGDAPSYGSVADDSSLSYWGGDAGNRKVVAAGGLYTDYGYAAVNANGHVQVFGAANYYGQIENRNKLFIMETPTSLRYAESEDGYYILGGQGIVQHFGGGPFDVSWGRPEDASYNVPAYQQTSYEEFRQIMWDMALAGQGDGFDGFYLQEADGLVFPYGNASDYGSPGKTGQRRTPGNYLDYSDIVKWFLAISGFLFYSGPQEDGGGFTWFKLEGDTVTGPHGDYIVQRGLYGDSADVGGPFPPVYGNIESTGAYADDPIDPGEWDKQTVYQCITKMKEIVGYIFYIDDEGAARFQSPNWWSIGNFWNDGTPTDYIPELDERVHVTDYQVAFGDSSLRSEIIISTEDPTEGNSTTITTRFVPASAQILRGMVNPAMWINGVFQNAKEQEIMAELIALHIWFQQRVGQVSCAANPCIQIDDQIRIFERTTAETYVHYVRGVSTQHDLDTGEYTMNLTTNWLGTEDGWIITADSVPVDGQLNPTTQHWSTISPIEISPDLQEWLKDSPAAAVKQAVQNNFGIVDVAPYNNLDAPPDQGTGAANG
jgi:hypothetical protein